MEALKQQNAAIALELKQLGGELERLYSDAQDFEFTIQEGKLFLLQSRTALRTPIASLQIACDMVRDSLIDERKALTWLSALDLDSLQVQRLAGVPDHPLATGTAACPGVASGPIALDPESAVAMDCQSVARILVRRTIETDDFAGMAAASGVLTAEGGPTSHAAVIARQMNKPCIVGCRDLVIDGNQHCWLGKTSLAEGDVITLDGHTGTVYAGHLDIVVEKPVELLAIVKGWRRQR